MTRLGENAGESIRRDSVAVRMMARASIFVLLVLAACARPGPDVLTPTLTMAPGARITTVFAATTRARAVPGTNVYTNVRSEDLNYGEFRISIPPGHRPGNIEWPSGALDSAVSFVTVQQSVLTRPAFELRTGAPDGKGTRVGVFVHGFNTNFQEALYRLAQLKADAHVDGVPILFAWPSEAKLTGYLADKDAVTYSRDQLADLLTTLARNRNVGSITVFAHSMGGWLTVEALRQIRIAGDDATLRRLKVVLAAPDIDVEVFCSQIEVIGPMSPPMTVLVSRDDLALSISSRLAGRHQRLGALDVNDPRVQRTAREARIEIIDISDLKSPDAFRHDRFAAFAAVYPHLAATGGGEMGRVGAFVVDGMGNTLAAPFKMLSGE
jgi:esterase/lipase superfamily enzyme